MEVAACSVWLACNALTIYASLSVYIYFVHEIDSICELLSLMASLEVAAYSVWLACNVLTSYANLSVQQVIDWQDLASCCKSIT